MLTFLVLSILLFQLASAFPIDSVQLTKEELAMLQDASVSTQQKQVLATEKLLPGLRIFFNSSANAIQVDVDDVSTTQQFPDTRVDDNCHHKITAEHPVATGKITSDTYLQFGVADISWKGATVFADASVGATLDIDAAVKVWVGEKIFGHCQKIGQKTVGVNVYSTGVNGLGLNFTASNPHVAVSASKSGFDLVFDFHADVIGLVLSWNVDDVTVHNCKIEILGIKIGSYCSLIEKAMMNGLTKLTTDISTVIAPNIQAKLEAALNAAIGSEIRIPIKL